MANEDRTNKSLVSALAFSNVQPSLSGNLALISAFSARNVHPSSTALVVRPHSPAVATTASNQSPQENISNVVQSYPETNVKLQSILKK